MTEINKLRNKLNLIQVYCYQAQKRGWARDHGCVEKFIEKICFIRVNDMLFFK